MTKKEFIEAIKDMPEDSEIVVSVSGITTFPVVHMESGTKGSNVYKNSVAFNVTEKALDAAELAYEGGALEMNIINLHI